MNYAQFLERKTKAHGNYGLSNFDIHEALFPFQKDIASWALRKGRCCLFEDTGLGKTIQQLEVARHWPGKRLILAPLAVAGQTILEAKNRLGLDVKHVREYSDIDGDGVYITNYDRLDRFEGIDFSGIVLDESSILKNHVGAYRQYIQERFAHTPFKLACTATPAPNDYMELGTHAEFVGAMSRTEMLATFFVHDGGDTSQWRLKKHAIEDFWKWVSTWAFVLGHPRDLGYSMPGYDLSELVIHDHYVHVEAGITGGLFGDGAVSATSLNSVLRESLPLRVEKCKEIFEKTDEPLLIWCNIDAEQDALEDAFPWCASVRGSDSEQTKEDRLLGFSSGKYRGLITKPKIAGYGMNWQQCSQMAFVGVTYSYEQIYQAIRRCYRFGQKRPVHVHLITSNAEESVKSALAVKQTNHESMSIEMRKYCRLEVA